jgi:hypothetical protein
MTERKHLSTTARLRIFEAAKGALVPDAEMARRLEEKSIPEPNSGCWLWMGAAKAKGYGNIWNGAKHEGAHRVSFRIHCHDIPPNMVVCHKCDNPACINPDHLWLGTTRENMHDCISKGRMRRGIPQGRKNASAILTEEDVLAIRADEGRYGYRIILAKKYGVCPGTISQIRDRSSWRHVK